MKMMNNAHFIGHLNCIISMLSGLNLFKAITPGRSLMASFDSLCKFILSEENSQCFRLSVRAFYP